MDDSKIVNECPYLSEDFCVESSFKDNHKTCEQYLNRINRDFPPDEEETTT